MRPLKINKTELNFVSLFCYIQVFQKVRMPLWNTWNTISPEKNTFNNRVNPQICLIKVQTLWRNPTFNLKSKHLRTGFTIS
jgi:hypothetical protein